MTSSASPSTQQRPRPSSQAAAAAQKKAALRDRTLRFTGDVVLVVCALNVLLLAAMFWIGYVKGKKAARAELRLSAAAIGGEIGDDPRLRSDAEAKDQWERPAPESKTTPKSEPSSDPSTPAAKNDKTAAADKTDKDDKTDKSSTAGAPTASEAPKTEKKWVVQAVSYEMGRKDLAESWKETLVAEKFENVELYKLGKDRPMIGLCVGEASNKQDLEGVLKRVQEFTSRNDRPFAGAVITQLAVTRR